MLCRRWHQLHTCNMLRWYVTISIIGGRSAQYKSLLWKHVGMPSRALISQGLAMKAVRG